MPAAAAERFATVRIISREQELVVCEQAMLRCINHRLVLVVTVGVGVTSILDGDEQL